MCSVVTCTLKKKSPHQNPTSKEQVLRMKSLIHKKISLDFGWEFASSVVAALYLEA
jgi:hypothetical protein